ncbi:CheY-like superfamily [Penicillium cf. griseofulvum]|uniref:CheY-like superfamily n=1 Tax=Penicillium cf. griseofulvum TaxID=2972120 RepID=A0A9W9JS86_9EURO|nr:CheY-like superfamily [Penicillium cf. griseofulvum]KAJ5442303.1 CheY-like superfamily [Penicillium cf. griseofulvum]
MSSSAPQVEPPKFKLAQERELYKYLKLNEVFQSGPNVFDTPENAQNQHTAYVPRLSPDTALTAFCQLGVLRLKAQRALISLFGRNQQYILAEATQTLSLQDHTVENDRDALWLGCCVVPKEEGICQKVASLPQIKPEDDTHVIEGGIYMVPDLREDARFNNLPMVTGSPKARFYAGAPIISSKGIIIGSYCIIDDEPRSGLDPPLIKFLQNMASTVMTHLDMARCKAEHHRAERMIVGFGSFVEGKATLRKEWVQETGLRLNEQEHDEGHLNILQQNAQIKSGLLTTVHTRPSSPLLQSQASSRNSPDQSISFELPGVPSASLSPRPFSSSSKSDQGSDASIDQISNLNKAETQTSFSVRSTASTENLQDDMLSIGVRQVFSRAANIIRESIEVEGVAFFDASIGSYGGLVSDTKRKGPGSDSSTLESSMGSSDDGTGSDSQKNSTASAGKDTIPENTTLCEILGFSTSATSSINDESKGRLALREVLLKALLRRYPHGKIFNYSEEGSISSDESSDAPSKSSLDRGGSNPNADLIGRTVRGGQKKTRSATLKEDGDFLIRLFPGARSIALLPMWDSHRARWFSGALVWTNTPRRVFTSETELTYLSAFGNSIMAEVHRLDVEMSEKAKTNLVSSISHELRSPLHGILGTSEILRDTEMNALQHGLVHTIESCGRTLLDTINHLLDFSKINNFRKESKNAIHKRKSPSRRHKNTDPSPHSLKPSRRARHSGMISLKADIQLDAVLEEVMESVFAGYSFYESSQRSMAIDNPDHMAPELLGLSHQESPVSIILDIDEAAEWRFSTQIGAWRRIMMNIFGNALKYTKSGFILVKLTASPVTPAKDAVPGGSSDFNVTLTVKDTGIGMSMEYLQNSLFTPFTQEDSLAPGNGLGLSIVYHAVLSMGGHIEVTSLRGRGTEVSIEVPLTHVPTQKANVSGSEPEPILKMKQITRGATLGLLELGSPDISDRDTILRTSLEKLCKSWFEMDIHILNPSDASFPECDFYVAVQTDTDSVHTWESWLSKTQNYSHQNNGSHKPPIVVICRSPEAAHHMLVAANQSNHEAIVEFISQPCGPRKLAEAFDICTKRQQGQEPLAEGDYNINQYQPRGGVTFKLTESPPVFRVNIETNCTENEMNFQKHKAGKKARNDEDRKSDETENSQHTHLSQNESGAITLPIRQGLSKTEEPTLNVLLVEDNDVNLRILVAHMKKEGYRYTTARNGLEALNIFKAHPTKFGVILMDISMPVMNGFESTRLIRKAEREYQNGLDISAKESFRPVTVVALTGLASASDRHEAYGSGMDLFLAKPIQRKQLFTVLNERKAGEIKRPSQ